MVATWGRAEDLAREDFSTASGSLVRIADGTSSACARARPLPAGANAACLDDLAGENGGAGTGTLILARARDEVGHAWLALPLHPSAERLSIEFDFFLRSATRSVSDGFSAVLVAGGIPESAGRPGASLGTGGLSAPYLSVAFDFRDDGGQDPESPCDDDFSDRTCHIEVNESADPAEAPSLSTGVELPMSRGRAPRVRRSACGSS